MDVTPLINSFEAHLQRQVSVAGGDPAVEAAIRAIAEAVEPAARQLAQSLVEQAAAEVEAQLPDHEVSVVLADGEPTLRVSPLQEPAAPAGGAYEARLTLRLPEELKARIEEAAGLSGDSVNSWVVKSLVGGVRRSGRRRGTRMSGTIRL